MAIAWTIACRCNLSGYRKKGGVVLEFPNLKIVRRVKSTLLSGMALLALLSLFQGVRLTMGSLEKSERWPRQPALYIREYSEKEIEIEVPSAFADTLSNKQVPESCFSHETGWTCLLIPTPLFARFSLLEDVELLQNPQHPDELELLGAAELWVPVCGYAIAAILLLLGRKRFGKSSFGEDSTWSSDGWIASASAPHRVGLAVDDSEPIRETGGSIKGVIFFSAMILSVIGLAIPGLVIDPAPAKGEAIIIIIVCVSLLLSVWYSTIRASSRKVYRDDVGFIDANLFSVKRVPWACVGSVELVNLNRDIQASHRRRFASGWRPKDLNVYVVSDKKEGKILYLSQNMSPAPAFDALLQRVRALGDQKPKVVSGAESARLMSEWNDRLSQMETPKRLFHGENRILLISLATMLLPFLLGTAYLSYRSLWFVVGAERAIGKVVEIKQDELPALVVEYQPVSGKALRIKSDGVESYGAFSLGDSLTVFYDASDPEDARIDLFLELWSGPIAMGALTGLVLLLVVLIARAATTSKFGV
ncbi:MAG: DUF3592 domain-containing protein [Gammaproteobacteria bacterium]